MDKNNICQEALKNIANANKMERVFYDEEAKQYKSEFFEVTDIARQSAMDAVTKFQNSDARKVLIYHLQDVADTLYDLEIRDGKLTLVVEVDFGMRMHYTYDKTEEMLYIFDNLEKLKAQLLHDNENKKVR